MKVSPVLVSLLPNTIGETYPTVNSVSVSFILAFNVLVTTSW